MSRKKKRKVKKKKSGSFAPSLKDKFSEVTLEAELASTSQPRKQAQSSHREVDDVDFAEWFHAGEVDLSERPSDEGSEPESADSDWLDFVNSEVQRMPEDPHASNRSRSKESAKEEGSELWNHERIKLEQRVEELLLAQADWRVERDSLQRKLSAVELESTRWRQRCAKLEQAQESVPSAGATKDEDQAAETMPISDCLPLEKLLVERGIPPEQTAEALNHLASLGEETFLSSLQIEPNEGRALLQRYLVFCCEHEECIAEMRAAGAKRALLRVESNSLCENCQGSENRRAVKRMIRACRENRRYKLVLVGGGPDAHNELQRLIPKGFDLKIVDGKERRDKQQATEDLRFSDLVLIWGAALPHKISELYTKQKSQFLDRIIVVQKRGVASLARSVCEFFETESSG